jgi:putative ABC transport system ATP-binding protein
MVTLASREPATKSDVDVVLTGVTKWYGSQSAAPVRAVDSLSLTVPRGSSVAVLGASGSGKSTLLHLIGGIERPDSGQLQVGGLDLTALGRRDLARYRRRVGFVFQRFHLLPALSAVDNVAAALLAGGRLGRERLVRAREALAEVGLAGRESALPAELSGGQQQRVAIARATATRPDLLLADEPTGNLDSATAGDILRLLIRLRDEYGTTLILVTHDSAVAASCERVVRLRDGRLEWTGDDAY